ncbi:hypothetical protein EW145_g1645 [Phellinidium pouzarii]|uniref:Dystroglycan-type cadherin-like domain-containing protein n=1 Tax=Phellinidium pouzarii TaxID=167371 RepID=A0A4S4LDP3_9AGAM|nr:hypothetical protein EW145_g1645 [Phellinidium pouzarii]
MACSRSLFALGLVATWIGRGGRGLVARAQTAQTTGNAAFQWSFATSMLSTDLTQCGSYPITVSSRNSSNPNDTGVPPYYLIAFKQNGFPTTSFIGSDPTKLSWQVNQASGSSLILTVADANGNSGGEPDDLYTIIDGDSTCLPSAPSTGNLTLTANISTSDPLETCQPLGLRVFGGQKPYNISIAALNSQVVTNVSLGGNDDVMTWVNRANPDTQLIVSVSDANGWGTGTGTFITTGSNDTDCTGLVSSTGNSANVNQHPTHSSKNSHTTVIVAVIVPVCALLLLAAAFFLWRRRRRHLLHKLREPEPAFMPDAWTGPSALAADGSSTEYSPYDPPRDSKYARYRDEVAHTTSRRGGGSQFVMTPLQASPAPAPAPRTLGSHSASHLGSHDRAPSSAKSDPRLPPGVSSQWNIEPDIIIQHRDGGTVTEIPPPYIDHGSSHVAGPSRLAEPSSESGGSSSTPLV